MRTAADCWEMAEIFVDFVPSRALLSISDDLEGDQDAYP